MDQLTVISDINLLSSENADRVFLSADGIDSAPISAADFTLVTTVECDAAEFDCADFDKSFSFSLLSG